MSCVWRDYEGRIGVRNFERVCNGIGLVCWVMLCVGTMMGVIEPDATDYCWVTGFLAFRSLIDLLIED